MKNIFKFSLGILGIAFANHSIAIENELFEISFKKPIPFFMIKQKISESDATLLQFSTSFKIDNDEITEFVPLVEENENSIQVLSNQSILEKIKSGRLNLITSITESIKGMPNKYTNLTDSSSKNILHIVKAPQIINYTIIKNGIYETKAEDIYVNKILIKGKPTNLEYLIHAGAVIQKIEFHNLDSIQSQLSKNSNINKQSLLLDSEWFPFWGYSHTYEISTTRRASLQWHYFYENKFQANDTYEHDWYLYNYTGSTYLKEGSTSTPFCWPLGIQYLATNYPSSAAPYWDTRLDQNGSCASTELPYTIGAGNAQGLPEKKWLYTFVHAEPGKSSYGSYKINAQKGYQWPTGCTSTWCSFGDEIRRIRPAWDYDVPAEDFWECVPTRYLGGTCNP